jgi:solute carrier family 25 protein 39/40
VLLLKRMPNDCCTSCCIDGSDCEIVKTIQHHSLSRQIFASSLASVVSTLSLNPITVVKVRLQNISSAAPSSASSTVALSRAISPLRNVVQSVFNSHGIAGFWSGTRAGIVMSVPNTVLYMSVYEHLKEELGKEPRLRAVQAISPALAGALARLVSATIISPLELVRTIQTGGASQSMGTIVKSIVAKDGIRGLYQGMLR